MHVRTNAPDNFFSRRQSRAAANAVDQFVFITEHERAHFEGLVGHAVSGQVIYNIADREKVDIAPVAAIPLDRRLRIGMLANFTWPRGHDRLLDIAEVLVRRGKRQDFLFVVAGDMTLAGYLESPLLEIGRRGGTFSDYVKARGLEDMFLFLGHVSPPEAALAGCDVVASPKRVDNPWGRDVIEALAFGLPVLSTGMNSRFVEDGVTGFLLSGFDPEVWADRVITLHNNRELCRRLGANGAERVARLCDGKARAADLLALWQKAVVSRKAAL
jgi:glycosyltransferase involved in cell wall biosynthesis